MVIDCIEAFDYRRIAKYRREAITEEDIKEVITQMHRLFVVAKQSIQKM